MYDFKQDLTDYNKTVEPIATETPKYDFQTDLKAFQDFQPVNPLEGVNNDLAIKAYREQKKKQEQQMKEMSKTADLMMESGNNPTPESVSSAQMTEGARKSLAGMQDKILDKAGVITQRFGNRNPIETFSGGVNYGTDIGVPRGTKVSVPPGKWKVIEAFAGAKEGPKAINRGYGNSILVQNEQTGEKMRFSHLRDVGVRPGETIDGNKIVGTSGSTGNSTGPHLDLEMYDRSGRLVDILNTPYSSYLGLGQGGGSPTGEGGGNLMMDKITQVGRDVIGAVGNTPILPFIPQITPNRMASYKAPLEDQTQNIPKAVRNAFPITQIPEQVGSAVRQIGRFASLKPDVMDLATAPLMFMGGVKAKEIPTSALKKISTTDRQIMGDFVTAIENGEAKKVLGNLGKDAENIAKALGIPETSTNKTIAKHFNDIIESMDKKGIKPLLDKEVPMLKPSTGGEIGGIKKLSDLEMAKTMTEDQFVQHHYTGNIRSDAYENYRPIEGLSWLGKPEKYPEVVKEYTLKNGEKVTIRANPEPLKYTKKSPSGEIVRDSKGMAVMMTPEEIKAKGFTEKSPNITVFNSKGQPIGMASNEFGATGVWVAEPYQKQGLGTELLSEFRNRFPKGGKIGQMTESGANMVRSYYRKLVGSGEIPKITK